MSDRFRADSALVQFLQGRLGAPECWPDGGTVKPAVIRNRQAKHLTSDAYGHTRPANAASFNEITKQY